VGDRVAEWRALADEIRDAILTGGWSASAKSFTRSFGSDDLDASNLMIPIVGFLPADDPRVLATIDAVADRLTDSRALVHRYRTAAGANSDGLAGAEGTFLLCTFWLAQALAVSGQTVRARQVFERPSGTSTTSACWLRRSTRRPVTCWATSRRRSATWDS